MIYPIISIVFGAANVMYAFYTKNYYAAAAWLVVALQGAVQIRPYL
jgi:uncharacterized protein involved in exopolysaccharide biosynthesis